MTIQAQFLLVCFIGAMLGLGLACSYVTFLKKMLRDLAHLAAHTTEITMTMDATPETYRLLAEMKKDCAFAKGANFDVLVRR